MNAKHKFSRLLSILLCLVMVAGMLPTVALAEDTTIKQYEVSTLDALYTAVREVNSNGGNAEIVLKNDITLDPGKWDLSSSPSDALKFTAGNVTILGEGHTLHAYNRSAPTQRGISISGDAVVNLGRDGYDQSLTIRGGGGATSDPGLLVPLFNMIGNAMLNMYDHVKICDSRSGGTTAGVSLMEKAQFNMYGGVIENCHNWASVSGGVMVEGKGTFNLSGGTISKCSGYGGGVIVNGGRMSFDKGRIEDCKSLDYGGAVCIYAGTAEITGGTITGNSASEYGGGIFHISGTLMIGTDAAIYNNTADAAGDDVLNYGGTISFSAPPSGLTLTSSGKSISGWYEDGIDGTRWKYDPGNAANNYLVPVEPMQNCTNQLALKAAHGLNYTVTFVLNGGKINSGNITEYVYGVGAALPTDVTKGGGFAFGGWYDNAEFSGTAVTAITAVDKGDKIYYAKWKGTDTPSKPVTVKSPPTGDTGNMTLWIVMLYISGGALIGTAVYGKKKKSSAK